MKFKEYLKEKKNIGDYWFDEKIGKWIVQYPKSTLEYKSEKEAKLISSDLKEKHLKEGKTDFWKDSTEYIIRELSKDKYEISVWKRGDTPSDVYKCTEKGQCSCPARGACKHTKLLKDWIKAGKPNKFFTKNVKLAVKRGLKKLGVKT